MQHKQLARPPKAHHPLVWLTKLGALEVLMRFYRSKKRLFLTPEISNNSLVVRFQVAPGYYIYRDKINMSFSEAEVTLGEGSFPPGEWFDDPEFGEVEIYRSDVTGVYPVISAAGDYELNLIAEHQGCAELACAIRR